MVPPEATCHRSLRRDWLAEPGGQHRSSLVAYYRAVTYARDERLALCALLDKAGPDAPTLCEGWRTADLAAHLVLRERRPDAALGIMGGPLAGYTDRVARGMVAKTPFPLLVETIRTGPPRLSVYGIPGADAQAELLRVLRAPRGRAASAAGLGAARARPRDDGPDLEGPVQGQAGAAQGPGRHRVRQGRPARQRRRAASRSG